MSSTGSATWVPSTPPPEPATPQAPRRRRRRWPYAVGVVVVLVAAGGWLAHRASQVDHDLQAAKAALAEVDTTLSAGGAVSPAQLSAARARTDDAAAAVRDPLWSLAARTPVLGAPLRTVTGIAELSARLADQSLPELSALDADLATVKARSAADGLPQATLTDAASRLGVLDRQLAADQAALATLPSGSLVPAVSSARTQVATKLAEEAARVHAAHTAASSALAMLGYDAPTTFLVLLENPAEARADMGLVGGFAVVKADHGHITVAQVGSNDQLPPAAEPSGATGGGLTAGYRQLGAGATWLSSNLSPDFAEDAQLFWGMYVTSVGGDAADTLSGVAALDPSALGDLLTLTGQTLAVPGASPVSGSGLADFLEKGEYTLGLDEGPRKALLADAGKQVIGAVTSAHVDTHRLLTTLATSANEGHLRIWSVLPSVESQLSAYPLAGRLPSGPAPFAGVYLDNSAATKTDPYLGVKVAWHGVACRAGTADADLDVALTDGVPTGLPSFVTSGDVPVANPVTPGHTRDLVSVLLTPGATIASATLDGQPVQWVLRSVETGGHPVAIVDVDVAPGATSHLLLHVAEPGRSGPATLATAPLPTTPTTTVDGAGC